MTISSASGIGGEAVCAAEHDYLYLPPTSWPESIGRLRILHTFVLESATKLSSRLESLGRLTALVTLKIAERNRLDKLPSRLGWFHSLRTLERDDNP